MDMERIEQAAYNEGYRRGYEQGKADAVNVVRCKECKHRNERCGMGEHRWCEMLNMSTAADDFCSYGERKES